MVTQEPHLCENCGHIDPLELPYCGFCGHPNVTATDEQRAAALTERGLLTPSEGTAAAAADLAGLISGTDSNGGNAEHNAPPGGLPVIEAPADSDFEFNADTVVTDDLEVPASIANELGEVPAVAASGTDVQWGDPGEFAAPPAPIDPFAEDFINGAPAS